MPAPSDHPTTASRRSFLGLASGVGIGVLLSSLSGLLTAGRAAAVSAKRTARLRPRWASWLVDRLNAYPDGWNEPGGWLPTILNSRHLNQYYEPFPNEAAERHHWAMMIDLRRCVGCQACVVACKSENNVPVGVYRTWVEVVEKGSMLADLAGSIVTAVGRFTPSLRRSTLPQLCNHCDNPPCVAVCPVKATFKRQDGPVLIDYTKCIGCGICVQSCPYDARYFTTVQETADKCTFCVHRLDRGLLPACVTSCVGRARVFGDLNNPESKLSQLLTAHPSNRLLTEMGTDPQIFYINLDGDLVAGASVFNTVYPYAAGTNTNEYDDLTGRVLLQTPAGGE